MTKLILKRLFQILGTILLILLLYLLVWPVDLDPQGWSPAPAPELTGRYEVNTRLAGIKVIPLDEKAIGPESIAADGRGMIFTGLKDGRIVKVAETGGKMTEVVQTNGRPLGMEFGPQGELVVCDAVRGVIAVNRQNRIEVLTRGPAEAELGTANDLAIARDGTIYFSDSSTKFKDSLTEILNHKGRGRLLVFNPVSRDTRVLLNKLHYANGVALAPDESFILVAETSEYRILRLWLKGPKRGQTEVFIDNLPGFPDGITSNGNDLFWVTMVAPRSSLLDTTLLPNPILTKALYRLPQWVRPAAQEYNLILALDSRGEVIHNLQAPEPSYRSISSVRQVGRRLYFGSLKENGIGFIEEPGTLW